MFCFNAILLGLAAAASLVQGAEAGRNVTSQFPSRFPFPISGSSPTIPTVTPTVAVPSAPTVTPKPLVPANITAVMSSLMAHIEQRDVEKTTTSQPATKIVEPALGPIFRSLISRLRDLERHQATTTESLPLKPVPTTTPNGTKTTKAAVISVQAQATATTEEPWFHVPTVPPPPVTAKPTTTDFKHAGNRLTTSKAANSTNATATGTRRSRPTKVPPPINGVGQLAAPMGAVVVFVAGCLFVL